MNLAKLCTSVFVKKVENKLKIYSKSANLQSVVEEHILYLGKVDDSIIKRNNTFRDLKASDFLDIIDYTNIDNCDFIIYTDKINKNSEISDLVNLSIEKNKKILLFFNDDSDEIFNFKNSIIFRTSLYKSTKPKNYLSVPAFCNNLKLEREYFFRDYNETPTVGFCGALTHGLRSQVISELNNSKNIKTNFLIRNSFWGGNVWGDTVRKQYIENTLNSDFVVCVRGAGNFSYRFYETMCLGKIPIVIDTDIDLPFEDFIDYGNYILKIPIKEIGNIQELVINYWNNISDYTELQKNIISFWESILSPIGFIETLNKYKNEISSILY